MHRMNAALIIALTCLSSAQGAEPCPSEAPDVVLNSSYNHDRWGTAPIDHRAELGAFVTSFDSADDDDRDGTADLWGVPEWVAYELRALDPDTKVNVKRPNPWYTDVALHAQGLAPNDDSYRNSGWERGHMCMLDHAERVGFNAACLTHTMLNACPQDGDFNSGLWLNLENRSATWAEQYGKVWVICGPVFNNRTPTQWIGEGNEVRVAIPDGFFKIVIREGEEAASPVLLAFLFPHNHPSINYEDGSADRELRLFLTSVDNIEALTGLDFLTQLDDSLEADVERQVATSVWD